MRANGGV